MKQQTYETAKYKTKSAMWQHLEPSTQPRREVAFV
jgi:hypothetical protein